MEQQHQQDENERRQPRTMRGKAWWYVATIVIGLWVAATGANGLLSDEWAEWPVNIWCLGLFGVLYQQADRKGRIEMITVLAFATPMELFFSEVWKIYEYQRGLMPLFVPVGHYFLFDLGRIWAERINASWSMPLLMPFVPLVLYGVWTGDDTSGALLLVFVVLFTMYGPQPRLYAAMVWAALGMEIVGTQLGNWTWAANIPWTPFTSWNPPLLVGAFYCLGDLLVNLSVAKFEGEPPKEVAP